MARGQGPGASLWLAMPTLTLLSACGYIGNPLPPALDIPSPVVDLRAAEDGDRILVEFTIPPLTTEGLALKTVRSVDLYAGPANTPFNPDTWVATARHYEIPAESPGPVAFDQIPAREWVGQSIELAVRATGPKGKTSAWSNLIPLIVGTPLAVPTQVTAENTADGVKVTWVGSGPKYRVFRAAGNTQPMAIGETNNREYLDNSAQFGTKYDYMVMAFEGDTQRSVVSQTTSVTPEDKFPPAVPAGVTAAAGTNTIELAWVRNTEADFRGYNIYRATGDGSFEKIASLIETPVFSDSKVEAGKTYRYQISAVDLLGNESARSETVMGSLP
ncbi:MAG: hypothetical protein JO307_03685 [Bryobacterales bacterium]|nr:hypothetical protein [Bryobacterales bacterium]